MIKYFLAPLVQIGEAIKNNPGFVELRRFEAAKEVAQTISSSANKVLLNTDTLLLDLWRWEREIRATGLSLTLEIPVLAFLSFL